MPIQLAAKELAEVVEALQDLGSDSRAAEQRKCSRMSVNGVVRLTPMHQSAAGATPARTYSALARDVSFQGIGLLQGMPAARGEQFVGHLPRAKGRSPLVVTCIVMYCRTLADGIYSVGAAFQGHAQLTGSAGGQDTIKIETDRIRASIVS